MSYVHTDAATYSCVIDVWRYSESRLSVPDEWQSADGYQIDATIRVSNFCQSRSLHDDPTGSNARPDTSQGCVTFGHPRTDCWIVSLCWSPRCSGYRPRKPTARPVAKEQRCDTWMCNLEVLIGLTGTVSNRCPEHCGKTMASQRIRDSASLNIKWHFPNYTFMILTLTEKFP